MDVIFISFNESNCDRNWNHLCSLGIKPKRVHGVKGIYQAHRQAAEISSSDFFFVVDGDNYVLPDFKFQIPTPELKADEVYVWRARNGANGLVYGYGGVKLYNKSLFQETNYKFTKGPDLATKIGAKYVVVEQVASETHFNRTPKEAWRGAFRECFKLRLNLEKNPGDQKSKERLSTWLQNNSQIHGDWVVRGAQDGMAYFNEVAKIGDDLKLNDFEWLNRRFDQIYTAFLEPTQKLLNAYRMMIGERQLFDRFSNLLQNLEPGTEAKHQIIAIFDFIESLGSYPGLSALRAFCEQPNDFETICGVLGHFRCNRHLTSLLKIKETQDEILECSRKERPADMEQLILLQRVLLEFCEGLGPEEIKNFKFSLEQTFSKDMWVAGLRAAPSDEVGLRDFLLSFSRTELPPEEIGICALNFMAKYYGDRKISELRNLLADPKQMLRAMTWIFDDVLKTPISYGLRRLVQEGVPKDFFQSISMGQIKSKIWLAEQAGAFLERGERILILGGWHGLLSALLLERHDTILSHSTSLDIDPRCVGSATLINKRHEIVGKFLAVCADMYEYEWSPNQFDWVINTSCEHLDDFERWYQRVPKGTKLILQSNDFATLLEHSNTVESLEDFASQTPMAEVFFEGTLCSQRYRRFMRMGRK